MAPKSFKQFFKKTLTPEQLAKKHKVDVNVVNNVLDAGEKVELEHTKNKKVARTIAAGHAAEDLKYYDKLKKMESK